jgi:hypothetical protein
VSAAGATEIDHATRDPALLLWIITGTLRSELDVTLLKRIAFRTRILTMFYDANYRPRYIRSWK